MLLCLFLLKNLFSLISDPIVPLYVIVFVFSSFVVENTYSLTSAPHRTASCNYVHYVFFLFWKHIYSLISDPIVPLYEIMFILSSFLFGKYLFFHIGPIVPLYVITFMCSSFFLNKNNYFLIADPVVPFYVIISVFS